MGGGRLDIVDRDRVAGWVWDESGDPVALEIVVDGVVLATALANGRRAVDGVAIANPVILDPVGAFDEEAATLIARVVAVTDETCRTDLLRCLTDAVAAVREDAADQASGAAVAADWRWRQQRGEQVPPLPRPKRVLVIDSRWPGRDAGAQALRSHILALISLCYEVSLTAADEMGCAPAAAIGDLAGVRTLGAPYYASVEEVLRLQGDRFDLVYLHREANATRYVGLVRHLQRHARILYSVADLHGLRLQRQGQITGAPEIEARGRSVLRRELLAAHAADVVVTHSTAEAALLGQHGITASVVPWAVPVAERVPPVDQRSGIVFVGNFAHAPNLDAARWLLDAILPRVWQRAPDLTCTVIGDEMPLALLAHADRRVRLLPGVEDIKAHLAQARLSVAPLRFGAGIKGKVIESFAAGVPCLMTSIAAEGLPELPATFADLIVDGAEAFAEAIVHWHEEAKRLDTLGRLGRDWVASAFAAERVRGLLGKALL